jgi:hypothetical protein
MVVAAQIHISRGLCHTKINIYQVRCVVCLIDVGGGDGSSHAGSTVINNMERN